MAEIKKLYNISLTGEKDLVNKMEAVNRSFDAAKKTFLELKSTLAQGNLSTEEMKNLKTAMELARLETIRLNQERIRLTNDGRALSNALKQERADRAANNQLLSQSTDEYKKASKELNILRNEAKALGKEFGIDSEVFIQASKKVNVLDKELKAIDAALGQFQRNVGNYPKEINIGKISTGAIDSLRNSGLGNLLTNQIDQTKGKVVQLNSEFARMKSELDQARAAGVTDLNALEAEIIQNRIEADRMNNEIQASQSHLEGMGEVGTGVFDNFRNNISQIILGYVGLQAAMSTVTELVKGTKELSDQTTNLEIELGKTSGGASKLVDQLAQLDTRTKLNVLEEMANIAAKAGVSEENLVGVTQAIDKIKIAFGKDFGDVETGTESLVKIINIFEGADQVNGDNLLKTGNALRTLANESVASVPFITDFTKRMAGLKGISDVSLPSVLGLASGFEQFGQTSEVSSTALVKIIPKLAQDVGKFAKIAGVTTAEFKKMINENPTEALIRVSEGLVKNKNGISDISKSFADSELGSGRIASVLGVLGKNADTFRKSIDSAGKAYQNTGNIEDAFKAKNENLASVFDKLSKKISDLANNKSFVNLISITGSAILGLITIIGSIPFAWWIGMIGFLTLAYWSNIVAIGANITATLAKIGAQVKLMVIQGLSNALIVASTIINYAAAAAIYAVAYSYQFLNIVLNVLTTVLPVLRTAMVALNSTILATPIGWLVAGIIAVTAVSKAFGNEVDNTSKKIRAQGEALRLTAAQIRVNAEIEKKATEATSERIAKLQVLTQIASDLNNSDASRKKALEELISIDERYKTALDGNIIKTDKLRQITDELTASILNQAKAEAAKNLLVEKQQQIIEKEFKRASLSKGALEVVTSSSSVPGQIASFKDLKNKFLSLGNAIGLGSGNDLDKVNNLTEEIKTTKEEVDYLSKLVAKEKTKPTDKKAEEEEEAKRKAAEEASKLSGGQKDYLKKLEAKRDEELAINETKYTKGLIKEAEYITKIRDLNVQFYDQKINYLKGKNAEELKEKAQASLAKAKIEKETSEKLFKIQEEEIKIQEEEIKQTLENQKSIAQAKLDNVNNDPGASSLDKAEAEKVYWEEMVKNQTDFNVKMDLLEKELHIESKKNAQDRNNILIKEQTDLNTAIGKLSKAQFEELLTKPKDYETYRKNQAEIESAVERTRIQNDKNLSQKEKEVLLQNENLRLANAIANIELGSILAQIKDYETKKLTNELTKDEIKLYEELLVKKAQAEEKKATTENDVMTKGGKELPLPTSDGLQKKLTSKLSKSFGLNEQESALLGESIAQSFDLASQAMNSYFEGEKQAVEQSKQLAYQRIDLEKKQLLAKAQSTAEREAIEKRAQIKKDKADKEAHEKLKKIKKQELTIAFAMQLANLGVAAAAAGAFAGAAAPIVIPILYASMAAVATAGYLLNMANINKQQFARGGSVPTKGGQFVGNSHANGGIPVGMNEFEGDELAIINKNSAQSNKVFTVTGTPKQIASGINEIGGGVSFASGAIFKKYATGGYFGSSVQPPVFRSYYENRSVNNANNQQSTLDLSEVKELLIQTNQTLSREVHRKTIISSREMSSIQKNDDKQSQIGTL